MYRFENLNHALVGMSKELLSNGVWEETRGFKCLKIPNPILICIENPIDRYVTVPERKWNKILPFAESLWLALGFNDLDSLPGHYVKNLYNFSDDSHTWRAGYGSRFRYWTGFNSDYYISDKQTAKVYSGSVNFTDQFKFVIDTLKRDINSRQAGITIHDPAKDDFNKDGGLKITKDQPCTRTIHFQMNDGKLDCTVTIRSNDILWGFSAINVFNFTLIQEYIANILGVPVGKYYHFVNNFHVYDNYLGQIISIANAEYEIEDYIFKYRDKIGSLENFDSLCDKLYEYEKSLRIDKNKEIIDLGNDMFNDWAKVFYFHHTKIKIAFLNPYLNNLFYGKNDKD